MKTALHFLKVLLAACVFIFALMFAVIEGRLLFSGDWLLHEVPMIGFTVYFCRLSLSVLIGYLAVRILFPQKYT